MARKKIPSFEFFNMICNKSRVPTEEEMRDYSPFSINRYLSQYPDLMWFAQEMNTNWQLSKELHFKFLFYGVEKRKRYTPYAKKEEDDIIEKKIELIKEYYDYSTIRARETISIIDSIPGLWDSISKELNKGGKKKII